jgi:hypothetical protein
MAVYFAVSNDPTMRDVTMVQALNDIDELLVPLIAEYQGALQLFGSGARRNRRPQGTRDLSAPHQP